MGFLVRGASRLIQFTPDRKVLKAAELDAFRDAERVLDEARARASELTAAAQAAMTRSGRAATGTDATRRAWKPLNT